MKIALQKKINNKKKMGAPGIDWCISTEFIQ